MSVTRDQLLKDEERAWNELHEFVSRIERDEWDRPGCTGEWSPKDVVAHIACWAAEGARRLECIRAGEQPKGPTVEEFNAHAYEACKDLTVEETLAMLSAAHHRLREEIDVVAPVALSGKVIEMIHEDADRHYREHLEQLRAFLGERA